MNLFVYPIFIHLFVYTRVFKYVGVMWAHLYNIDAHMI